MSLEGFQTHGGVKRRECVHQYTILEIIEFNLRTREHTPLEIMNVVY